MNFGADEASLLVNGQTPAAPKENQWRPQQVGALTYCDVAHIGKKWSKDSYSKYMLTARDAAGNFRRRFYLPNLRSLAKVVRRYRNFVLRKGFNFVSILADGEFDTEELEEVAALTPTFDTNFSPPYAHVKAAEADIKAWRLRIRQVMKTARSDPMSKVQIKHWPYASECITDIENMLYCEQSPAQTPWESMLKEQPDWAIAQIPLCRIWFFVYPSLRQSAPFADRRAEGIFAGISLTSSSYKILNTATGRMILRPFAACVTREPKEVFNYSDTVRAAETLFYSNQNPFTKDDRRFMFETGDNDLDNFSEMTSGNDPRSYQLGPEIPPDLANTPANLNFDEKFGDFFAGESDDEDRDPADPDSDSEAEEPVADLPTLQCTGKKPKSGDIVSRVLALEGKTRTQALNSSFRKNGGGPAGPSSYYPTAPRLCAAGDRGDHRGAAESFTFILPYDPAEAEAVGKQESHTCSRKVPFDQGVPDFWGPGPQKTYDQQISFLRCVLSYQCAFVLSIQPWHAGGELQAQPDSLVADFGRFRAVIVSTRHATHAQLG